jgi:hypothetical protein
MIASLAGGSITLTKNNVDGAEIKDTNDGHRHLCFPLSSHFEYTMYFGTTIQFYNDTIMQSQYISSQTHTLQIRWRRVTPVCREHFRGGGGSSEVNRFKSSRQPIARRGVTISQPHQTINLC